jgi:hypothetical protein
MESHRFEATDMRKLSKASKVLCGQGHDERYLLQNHPQRYEKDTYGRPYFTCASRENLCTL